MEALAVSETLPLAKVPYRPIVPSPRRQPPLSLQETKCFPLRHIHIHILLVVLASLVPNISSPVSNSLPTMRPPLRIAVLECDQPIGRTYAKYGGYGNLFKELLETAAEKIEEKPELDVTKFDVVNTEHYPKLEDVDAVLLTGSRKSCYDGLASTMSRSIELDERVGGLWNSMILFQLKRDKHVRGIALQ